MQNHWGLANHRVIKTHKQKRNEQLRNKFVNKINIERWAVYGNFEPVVLDQDINKMDEYIRDNKIFTIDQKSYNISQANKKQLFIKSLNGSYQIYTFVYPSIRSQIYQDNWAFLYRNQQWSKIMLDKDVTRFGAAFGLQLDQYDVFTLSKVPSEKASFEKFNMFLQGPKKNIMASNPTVTSEDLDLSNRIAEWIKKGKPMGSIQKYFNSISYKPGEKIDFRAEKGSYILNNFYINNYNYFKMDKDSGFTKFGIAADVNAEGEMIINVVFAG